MKHVLILVVLGALLAAMMYPRIDNSAYGYDESDYMTAARHGLWANLWDEPAMPLSEFIGLGLSSVRGSGPKVNLSEAIRSIDDVPFHRHNSGPVYFLWLHLLQTLTGSEEASMRGFNRLITLLNLLVIYGGCLWVLEGRAGFYAALVSGILFATSYTSIILSELCPHPLYITFYLAALFALTKAVRQGERRYWLLAVVLSAIAANTLMVGFLTVIALVAAGWWHRRAWSLTLGQAVRDLGVFLSVMTVTWPAALLKLSLVKSYSILAYLSVFRKNVWGDLPLSTAWAKRLAESPLDWLFFLIAAVALYRLRAERRDLWHWAVFIVFTLAVVGRIPAYGPRYVTPLVPAMFALFGLLAGPWLAGIPQRRAGSIMAALCVCTLGLLALLPYHYPIRFDRSADPTLAVIRSLPPTPGMRLLVPQLAAPALHYYFPQLRLSPYTDADALKAGIASGGVDAVLREDNTIERLR